MRDFERVDGEDELLAWWPVGLAPSELYLLGTGRTADLRRALTVRQFPRVRGKRKACESGSENDENDDRGAAHAASCSHTSMPTRLGRAG